MYWNLSTKFCSHFVLLIWFFTGFERGYQETNMQQEYLSFVVPYLIDLDIDSNLDYNYISNYLWLLPIMVVCGENLVKACRHLTTPARSLRGGSQFWKLKILDQKRLSTTSISWLSECEVSVPENTSGCWKINSWSLTIINSEGLTTKTNVSRKTSLLGRLNS